MMANKIIVAFLIAVVSMSATVAWAGQKGIFDNPKEPKMTAQLNVGKLNYRAFCAACHGKTGRGTDSGPTFINRIYLSGHHPDRLFYKAAKGGAPAHHWKFGDMPPVEGITDDQLSAIVAYVRAVQQANGLF